MIKSDKLVEATILALQGKLTLTETRQKIQKPNKKQENVNVIVDDEDNSTYIETPDTVVTVANKDTVEEISDTPEVLEIPVDSNGTIVPEEDLPQDTVEDILDTPQDEVITDEPTEDVQDIIEASTQQNDSEDILPEEDTTNTDEPTIDEIVDNDTELNESKKLDEKFTDLPQDEIIEALNKGKEEQQEKWMNVIHTTQNILDTHPELESNQDELITYIMFTANDIYENKTLDSSIETNKPQEDDIEDKTDESEVGKYDSKTFNEVFTKYFTQKYANLKEYKITKLGVSSNGLKIEGILTNKLEKQRPICMEMKKVTNGKNFTKYTIVESKGLLKESKDTNKALNLMIQNKNNVLQCKYLMQK